MIGYREDLPIETWSPPKNKKSVSVAEAIGDLPSVPAGHQGKVLAYLSKPSSAYQKNMRSTPEWRYGRKTSLLTDHICRRHNQDDIALFKKMKTGAKFADLEVQKAIRKINPEHKLIKYSVEKFKDKLHKLDPDKAAWTVTAHLQKDCYKFIHYADSRTITVREAARLQSFPDWFNFGKLAMCPSFRLIGNAVPPLLSKAFAESFLLSDSYFDDMLNDFVLLARH
jgi:DNA (cytosine-5)-methyltransferase 1